MVGVTRYLEGEEWPLTWLPHSLGQWKPSLPVGFLAGSKLREHHCVAVFTEPCPCVWSLVMRPRLVLLPARAESRPVLTLNAGHAVDARDDVTRCEERR